DTNSSRKSERAARSSLMAQSFRAAHAAAASRSAPDHLAEPVAEAGQDNDVDREHRPAQQGNFPFQCVALLRARGGIARPEAALGECHKGPVGHCGRQVPRTAPRRPASDRSIMPLSRHFCTSAQYCKTPATIATMASESGRNTFQPSPISWQYGERATMAVTKP